MKIIRDFVPIGQGGFTIETFNPAGRQFVFDCGSITSEDILNHEIHDHFFDDKARESAVFLSHMHEDHINGVTELLKHANVTDIYVPFRTYEAIAFDFFRYMSDREKRGQHDVAQDQAVESLILGQYGDAAFNNYGINWHRISPIGANNPNISETDSQTQQEVLSSGIPIDIDITPSSLQWIITPYVFLDEEKLNHIREKLEENAVDLAEIASSVLPEFWKEHKKQIRTAFDSLKMNLNLTSMVVYSGPKKVTPKEWIWSKDLGKSYIEGEVGCLYTGDICLKSEVQFEKLKTELGDLWSNIGVIQMPHHGSSYSYNNKLSREDWQFVISAGTTNRYRHPSHKVIADLLSKENCVRIVTEHKGSELLYLITTLADHTEDAL